MTTQTAIAPQPSADVIASDADMPAPFSLDISSILALLPDDDALDEWFLRFTADNEDLGYQFEIDQHGRLWAMASEGMDGLQRAGNLYLALRVWSDDGPGGLVMPGNGLVRVPWPGRRGPDAGWVSPEQLASEPPAGQRPHGVPFAPRFVAEIRSISNSLEDQQDKMEEWIAYGVSLGWLIDPFLRQVHIYRPNTAPEILDDPETISGAPELPGFTFNVRSRIFDLQ
ncbi:MAG: Uma2 family endonuclease [Chloroflexota bacterium]|nr:Uma2 family endonuclease [Chloroflexota bacterium]MDE2683637.1 Uma2 family endonuclease [Chloroflexota bacterium]